MYLSEQELVTKACDLLKADYDHHQILTQRRIGDRIIDAMMFVQDGPESSDVGAFKIIGIEAKTDADTYYRLFDQLDQYLKICDVVYLVIENQRIPINMAHYVGVIKITDGVAQIVRKPSTLRHDIDNPGFWLSLLDQMGGRKEIRDVLVHAENIKRKLVWNQYIVGFTKCNRNDPTFQKLNPDEKKLLVTIEIPKKRRRS